MKKFYLYFISFILLLSTVLRAEEGKILYSDAGLFKIENKAYFLSDLKSDLVHLKKMSALISRFELSFDWLTFLGLSPSYLGKLESYKESDFPLSALQKKDLENFILFTKLCEFIKSQDIEINEKNLNILRTLEASSLEKSKIILSTALYLDSPKFKQNSLSYSESELSNWQRDKGIKSKEEAIKSLENFKRQESLKQFFDLVRNQYTHEFI